LIQKDLDQNLNIIKNHSTMATQITKCLISLLVSLFLVSSTLASSDAPFIVAHKKATLTRLKPGIERVSVSIDIYNQGSATAYDVSLTDDSWSKDTFEIVSGNTSMSWERLDAGALVSHAFELDSKVQTLFYGAPAVITFRVPTKAALQEAYSTPILPLDILADKPAEKKFDLAKRLLAKYGSLVSVISIVTLFIYLLATPSSGAAKGGKKKR
jgi:translocon-associated protein subunit beta